MGTSSPAVALNPADLLFGSTRRRVLGWLLQHPEDAYYLRELVRHTGGAVGAVQRELEQLTAAGLVRRDVRGKQVYFQVNRGAPIFPELHGLFAKTVLAEPAALGREAGEVADVKAKGAPATARQRARTRRSTPTRSGHRRSPED
jgi:DNA-binding transcriptional ArsR family regulator